jgi:Mediator complex subunit 24 N-terminal
MLMQVILSKMVHDLLPAESIPRPNPSAFILQPQTPTRDVLLETFRRTLNNGYVHIDDIHKMDYLLNVGGPQWFCEHLVRVSANKLK